MRSPPSDAAVMEATLPWRVGRKVGRTIYLIVGDEPSDADVLIGVMDTPELAAETVRGHNLALVLRPEEHTPPWAVGELPRPDRFMESERFVAGALSTMLPFSSFHPSWALPFARRALEALSEWEPKDA